MARTAVPWTPPSTPRDDRVRPIGAVAGGFRVLPFAGSGTPVQRVGRGIHLGPPGDTLSVVETANGTDREQVWSVANTILLLLSIIAFVGAVSVFVFGVVLTHGVYGSRMAWFLGVCVPLLAISAVLSWGASRRSHAERRPSSRDVGSKDSRGVRAAGSITKASLALIGIPVALAAMLLFTYGVLFAFYWLGR